MTSKLGLIVLNRLKIILLTMLIQMFPKLSISQIDDILYIASEKGLFEQHFSVNNYRIISGKQLKNIDKYINSILGNDNDMWKIDLNTLKTEKLSTNVVNFSLLGDLLWTNHVFNCKLLNINSFSSWDFSNYEGIPGSIIYNIKSDNDNVLFMTNDGLAIYEWEPSDYE